VADWAVLGPFSIPGTGLVLGKRVTHTQTRSSMRSTLAAICLVLAATGAEAQPIGTPVNSSILRVDLLGVAVRSGSQRDFAIGDARHWVAYQGYDQLSERNFFALTGHDELAARSGKRKRRKMTRLILGGVGAVAGGFLVGTAFGDTGFDRPNMAPVLAGGLLTSAGLATIGFTAATWNRRTVPYWMASEIATGHNASHR
jgi:hypothetical protein